MKSPLLARNQLRYGALSILTAIVATSASAQLIWNGSTDNDWLTAGNWTGTDAPPDALGETAQFDSVQANNAPNLSADTTIGQLVFATGAGSYSIGGSQLTIDRTGEANSIVIDHSAGNTQTISSDLRLRPIVGGGTRTINVSAGSTINLNGSVTSVSNGADNNIGISGAGTVNFGGSISGNQIQQRDTTTVNINGSVNAGTYYSFSNTGRINFNASTSRGGGTGSSSSGTGGQLFITTDGVSIGSSSRRVEFRGGNNGDHRIGADIIGGGTATINTLGTNNSTRTNTTYRIHSSANNILIISNSLRGGTGSGSFFSVEGGGIVRLSGSSSNSTTVPVVVNNATLQLNKTDGIDALGASVALTVNSGGTVQWLENNQLSDGLNSILNGGTLDLDGLTDTVGTLDLDASSFLDLGNGGVIAFADSSALDWSTFTLNITASSFVDGASVRFGTDSAGLTGGQLSLISINGVGAGIDSSGFLVAIPETSTYAAFAGLLALGVVVYRRRC